MNIKILSSLLLFSILGWSQNSNTNYNLTKFFYKDNVPSIEIWKGADKKLDSLKTYYRNGNIQEIFYYDEKGFKNSNCYQYNEMGEKLVTWNFSHGRLISRTDHKLPFNKVSETIVKTTLDKLNELNTRTNYNATTISDLYKRANYRYRLGNMTLAIEDFRRVEKAIDNIAKKTTTTTVDTLADKKAKFKSLLYDLLANSYSNFEMENFALNYFYKAMTAAPNDYRILYNFANYLQNRKSNDLALYYMKKILAERKEHPHARWGIAKLYSDMGDYEKAMYNINLAFEKEDVIIKGSLGHYGRDLRTTRGLLYHKLGESEKGISDLKEALERNKNNSYAMKNLGIIYLDQKKYDAACELFEKAKELKYNLTFDENDLDALIESACNNIPQPEIIETSKAYVFPNPAKTIISVKNYEYQKFDYAFYDFESNPILNGKSNDGAIDVSTLNPGFYILKILNTDSPQTFKIIKE